jgi:hypothetical protein
MNNYFNLDFFIESYLLAAFEYAGQNLSLETFDCKVRQKLCSSFNFLEKEIIQIHHPFHWVLFCDKEISLLELFVEDNSGENAPLKVRTRKRICSGDKERVAHYLNENYSSYLENRIREFNLNTLHETA